MSDSELPDVRSPDEVSVFEVLTHPSGPRTRPVTHASVLEQIGALQVQNPQADPLNRWLAMQETEQLHRHEREDRADEVRAYQAETDRIRGTDLHERIRGASWRAFGVVVVCLVASVIALFLHYPYVATAFFGATLLAVIRELLQERGPQDG